MLHLYRRHTRSCPHRSKGTKWTKCDCPVWCRGRVANAQVRESLDTNSWERAKRKADLRERQIEDGREPQSVSDAVESYLAAKSVENSTRRRYARALRPLVEFSKLEGIELLDGVRLGTLDKFKAWRKVSNLTWSKELETLRGFFRYAVKRAWCEGNPAAEMESPKGAKMGRPRQPYTSQEVANIFRAAMTFGKGAYERLRARAMVILMNRYGLRVSDVATLRKDRIQGDQIFLYAHKNGNPIWAPLYPEVRRALEVLPLPTGADPDCEYFFWSGKGDKDGHIKTIVRTLQSVFRESGVEHAVAHRFRHTIAVKVLVNGGTIEDAASILGDSPAVIRKHYLPWCSAFQSRITAALNRAHKGGLGTSEVRGDFPPLNPSKSTFGMVLEVGVDPQEGGDDK